MCTEPLARSLAHSLTHLLARSLTRQGLSTRTHAPHPVLRVPVPAYPSDPAVPPRVRRAHGSSVDTAGGRNSWRAGSGAGAGAATGVGRLRDQSQPARRRAPRTTPPAMSRPRGPSAQAARGRASPLVRPLRAAKSRPTPHTSRPASARTGLETAAEDFAEDDAACEERMEHREAADVLARLREVTQVQVCDALQEERLATLEAQRLQLCQRRGGRGVRERQHHPPRCAVHPTATKISVPATHR